MSADAIERMVERAAARVEDTVDREVSSGAIGMHLLEELRRVDEVSFARFASVYQRFEALDDFLQLAARMTGTGDDGVVG